MTRSPIWERPTWRRESAPVELSPVEVVRALLERGEKLNPQINALVTPMPRVEERAREAEAALSRGDDVPPLHGVPFTIKDSFDTAGVQDDTGLGPVRRPRARARRSRDHAAGRGGRHPARQDEPAGLRALVGDRQPRLRAHAQPVGSRAQCRRLERGRGRGDGRRPVAARYRKRPRRVGPASWPTTAVSSA